MKTNFQDAILNAINTKFTGRLIFMGPEGGVVRVVFIEGKIKEVDSTWGYGPKELDKIKEWKEGNVISKELSERDIERYKGFISIEFKFTCPNCGHEIPANTNFCPECGHQIKNVKVCLNCGFENPIDAKFCEKCGNKFYTEQITKNIKICPSCSSVISQSAKFCPECGYSFLKVCPRCKSENPPEAKFCEECGYDFSTKKFNFNIVLIPSIFLILILIIILSIQNKKDNKTPKILQAPNIIQEFLSFADDTNKGKISKVETLKISPKQKNISQNPKIEIKDSIKISEIKPETVKKYILNCSDENYKYKELKIQSISFEISENKTLPYYKYGPIKLNPYDTIKVYIEVISGILRSKDAILLALNSVDINYLETDYYKANLDNFDKFVKSGFNLPFHKTYINQKGEFKFSPNSQGNYYIVVINPPYIEKSQNKTFIKTKPLFFNLSIVIKKCNLVYEN